MIRVTAIANSAAAKAYFALSDDLLEGPEVQAHGHGKGAEMLGLTGPVNYADFEKRCDNINPATGTQLTATHLANQPRDAKPRHREERAEKSTGRDTRGSVCLSLSVLASRCPGVSVVHLLPDLRSPA
jgi:hypothetical protein